MERSDMAGPSYGRVIFSARLFVFHCFFFFFFYPDIMRGLRYSKVQGGGGGALGVALWHRSGPERWNSIVLDLGGVGVSYLGRASSVIFVVPVTSLWRGSTVPYYT